MERAVISSVISTNIRAIIFTLPPLTTRELLDHSYMQLLDNVMHRLVGKLRTLGYRHTPTLEFRLKSVTFNHNLNYKTYLPKFREDGRVRILDTSSGKALEITVRSFFAICIVSLFLTGTSASLAKRSRS